MNGLAQLADVLLDDMWGAGTLVIALLGCASGCVALGGGKKLRRMVAIVSLCCAGLSLLLPIPLSNFVVIWIFLCSFAEFAVTLCSLTKRACDAVSRHITEQWLTPKLNSPRDIAANGKSVVDARREIGGGFPVEPGDRGEGWIGKV